MSPQPINLLIALQAEAKPLIRALGLKRRQPDGVCPIYASNGVRLAMSGPGKVSMQQAIHLLHQEGVENCHWLNLGIAGHASLALGSCLQATAVTDSRSGERWRLQPVSGIEAIQGELRCVAEPESVYGEPVGYDMESGGFAATLASLGLIEHAHILKVISDNPQQPARQINARMVEALIGQQLHVIHSLIEKLR
jgi:hypothetical protein